MGTGIYVPAVIGSIRLYVVIDGTVRSPSLTWASVPEPDAFSLDPAPAVLVRLPGLLASRSRPHLSSRMSALNLVLSSFLPSMPPSSAFQWFLLVGPAVVVLAYFVTIFPHTPNELYIHPSLATLDKSTPSWSIYPDNYYEGGAYVKFPQGSVSPVCSTSIAFISTNMAS